MKKLIKAIVVSLLAAAMLLSISGCTEASAIGVAKQVVEDRRDADWPIQWKNEKVVEKDDYGRVLVKMDMYIDKAFVSSVWVVLKSAGANQWEYSTISPFCMDENEIDTLKEANGWGKP